jgi:hypothetical protein
MLKEPVAHRREPRPTLERIAEQIRRRPQHARRRPSRRPILNQLRRANGQHDGIRPTAAVEQRRDAIEPIQISGIDNRQLRGLIPLPERALDDGDIDAVLHERVANHKH